MAKEKRILFYFIGWFIVGLCIFLIGVINVDALENYEDIGYLNDNTNFGILYDGVPNNIPQNIPIAQEWNLTDFKVNRFILEFNNYNFNAETTYNIELSLPLAVLTNSVEYSVTIYDAVNPSNHVSCNVGLINNYNPNYPNFTFKCPISTNKLTLEIYSSNNTSIITPGWFRWNYAYLSKYIDKNDIIISGQEEIKDTITDNLNSKCSNLFDYNMQPYVVALDGINYTNNKGVFTFNGTGGGYKFIVYKMNLEKGTYNFGSIASGGTLDGYSAILEKGTDDVVFCYGGNCKVTLNNDGEILFYIFRIGSETLTFNNFVAKPYISKTSTSWCEFGSTINKIDETNDKLNDIENTLTDTSQPNTSGLENSAGWLPPGPLDSILNLPLTMLNSLTNSLNKTCSPLNLTLPYVNKQIQIPCLSAIFAKITGVSNLWTWVGTIASVLMLYSYLLNLYAWVDRVLTLRAEFDEAMGADLGNWGRL